MSSSTNSVTGTPVEASTALPVNTQPTAVPMPQPIAAAAVPMTEREVDTFYNAAMFLKMMENGFEFPESFGISGNLDLSKTTFSTLPQGLRKIEGNLTLDDNAHLETLPEDLEIDGNLFISGSIGIQSLPRGLIIGGRINIQKCPNLKTIGENVQVKDTIYIHSAGLISIGEGLKTKSTLQIYYCSELTSLPKNVQARQVELLGCAKLTAIGEGLRVRRSLCIEKCPMFTTMPDDFQVGIESAGSLAFKECPSLTSLPKSIMTLGVISIHDTEKGQPTNEVIDEENHYVYLEKTGLSEETIAELKEAKLPGLIFRFPEPRLQPKPVVFAMAQPVSPSAVALEPYDDLGTGPSLIAPPQVARAAAPSLFRRMTSAVAAPVVRNASWMVWRGTEAYKHNIQKSYDNYEFAHWLEMGYNFPANVTVTVTEGELKIRVCKSLPKGLKVQGSMTIEHNLPPYISERDRIPLTSEGMEIEGNLTLRNVLGSEELAKGIKVKGDLILENCQLLKSLSDVQVGGNIIIRNCPKLENLPKGLKVRKDLTISECPNLKELPVGLGIQGNFTIEETNIESLPEGFILNGNLIIKECPHLVLPKGKESLTASQIIGGSIIDEGNFKVVRDDDN